MMLQELCEGIPLRDWMVEFQRTSTEGINEQDLVKVINVVTRTLIHVHEAGIVHCDMKPDNSKSSRHSGNIFMLSYS